jgi:hypothetical protein
MLSLDIQIPAPGSLVLPTAHDIVVDVGSPGTNPLREFHIAVNATNVLTVIAGTVTFVDPAYACVVTVPSVGIERMTLTRLSDWPNPSDLVIDATYQASPLDPLLSETSSCVAASYSLQAGSPYQGQADVSAESSVSFAFTTTAVVAEAEVFIAGKQAVKLDPLGGVDWNSPDFVGRLINAGGTLSVAADPRRAFDPEQTVSVELALKLISTNLGSVLVDHNLVYEFHTRTRTTFLDNPSLRFSRVDLPFQDSAASETLRYVLRSALLPRPSSPSFEVALYLQITRSSLGSVASQFRRSDLEAELSRLVAEDMPSITTVDAVLTEVAVLWDAALQEASDLGLGRELLQLIARTYAAPYPQERVGAACALIFAQAPLRA